uniref:CSON014892 protein n=1 Tax=Culicoides sonorensis TaxID=179676 RepID=A0A336KSN7_CULSO
MSFNSQYIVVIVLFLSAFNSSEGKDLTKIYGGGPALQNETLHQISIRIIENEEADGFGEGHNCGGTLISPLIVLTAAHCMYKRVFSLIPPFYKFEEYELDELYIVMGTLNRTERTNNTIVRATAAWKIHENYDREDMPFDIALIKLNESVPLDIPTIRPLTNLASTRVAAGTNCKVSGWEHISRTPSISRRPNC